MTKEQCNGFTKDKRYPYPKSPCNNNVWKDGYCKIHHPDEKKKRHKESMDNKEKLYQQNHQQSSSLLTQLNEVRKENERLREALQQIKEHFWLYNSGYSNKDILITKIQSIATQALNPIKE